MTPTVFVVDTNAVIAGLMTDAGRSPVAWILDAMLSGSLRYLLSPERLAEYRSVLLRPKLTKLHGLAEVAVDRLLAELTANAMWREPHKGTSNNPWISILNDTIRHLCVEDLRNSLLLRAIFALI